MCLLVNICHGSVCCPCVTQHIALVSYCFKSITCMCYVIVSLQRLCVECCVAFSVPRCFPLVTMYGTTHAHLVLMCWPLLSGFEVDHQSGGCITKLSMVTGC